MIRGYITRGTTVHGRAVNEGEIHDLDPDTFRRLRSTGDVTEVTEVPEAEPEPEESPKPTPKKKK